MPACFCLSSNGQFTRSLTLKLIVKEDKSFSLLAGKYIPDTPAAAAAEELTNYPIGCTSSRSLFKPIAQIVKGDRRTTLSYSASTRVFINLFKVISDYDKYCRELIKTMPSQLSETVIEEAMTDLWLSLRQSSSPSLSFHTSGILRKTDSFILLFNIILLHGLKKFPKATRYTNDPGCCLS